MDCVFFWAVAIGVDALGGPGREVSWREEEKGEKNELLFMLASCLIASSCHMTRHGRGCLAE
jgi:hypothetical protein